MYYDRSQLRASKRFIGVYHHRSLGLWRAQFKRHDKLQLIGNFPTEIEAAIAFNQAVRDAEKNSGFPLSRMNFIENEGQTS